MKRFDWSRREVLKLIGASTGTVLLDNLHLPLTFGEEVFPAGRINWICYVKAGGGFDLIARSVAPFLGKYLNAEVLVKNVPQAGGNRAFWDIFHAKPDGYTIGDFNTAFVTENIGTTPEFDCGKYTYLVRTGVLARVIAVNKRAKFKSWEEMLKAGKERELKLAVGNFARGAHITAILLKEIAKLPARFINFPGAVDNANALLRGDVDMAMLNETSAKTMVDAGEFQILTVLSETSRFPGVPSIAELGYPELADFLKVHYLVVGPPNIPNEITRVLTSALRKVFSDNGFIEVAKKINFEPDPLYGIDAERLANKIFKYYEEKTPILKKYLT